MKKVLKGREAREALDAISRPRDLETRIGDISFQLHLLNENIKKLINKL